MIETYNKFDLYIHQIIDYYGGLMASKKIHYAFGYETMSKSYSLTVYEIEVFKRKGIEL